MPILHSHTRCVLLIDRRLISRINNSRLRERALHSPGSMSRERAPETRCDAASLREALPETSCDVRSLREEDRVAVRLSSESQGFEYRSGLPPGQRGVDASLVSEQAERPIVAAMIGGSRDVVEIDAEQLLGKPIIDNSDGRGRRRLDQASGTHREGSNERGSKPRAPDLVRNFHCEPSLKLALRSDSSPQKAA